MKPATTSKPPYVIKNTPATLKASHADEKLMASRGMANIPAMPLATHANEQSPAASSTHSGIEKLSLTPAASYAIIQFALTSKILARHRLSRRSDLWIPLLGCVLTLFLCWVMLPKVYIGNGVGVRDVGVGGHGVGVDRKSVTRAHPVILIPGDGGTQVEAKLNKTSGPHYFCTRKTNYW